MVGESPSTRGWRTSWAGLTAPRRLPPIRDGWTWLAVAVGIMLRVMEYTENRPLYRDEKSLLKNLEGLPILDFSTVLTEYQLAPPGFLILERLMVRLPFNEVMAARLIPLAFGIASLFLFRLVARRYLSPGAVPLAVGLLALCDWLVYYSSEIKQYSCDVALTLVALLLAAGPTSTAEAATLANAVPSPVSRRRMFILTAFGAVGVWFSYPLAMVLAAVGTYRMAVSAARRDWRQSIELAAMGLVWISSFAACYVVSHRILSKESFIWNWWDFAFLPVPPRSFADLSRDFWHLANLFINPAYLVTPLGILPSAILALGLSLLGGLAFGRRWPGGLYLITAPILFALLASAARGYPFHGRLLLFLVPSVDLLVAEGAVTLTRRGGKVLVVALSALLLYQPAADALWFRAVVRRVHDGYDSHGDLWPDLLDYLESVEVRSRRSNR